jgi:hypothetical protein
MALSEVDRLIRLPLREDEGKHTPRHSIQREIRRALWLKKAQRLIQVLGKGAAPALAQLRDHYLTIASFACADWAAFLWNEKTGLTVAAVLLLSFELKVSR